MIESFISEFVLLFDASVGLQSLLPNVVDQHFYASANEALQLVDDHLLVREHLHVSARVLLVQIWIQDLLEIGVFDALVVVLAGHALVEDFAAVGDRGGDGRRVVEDQRARQTLHPVLCGLQLDVVSVLARQEVAEGRQLLLLLVD